MALAVVIDAEEDSVTDAPSNIDPLRDFAGGLTASGDKYISVTCDNEITRLLLRPVSRPQH